MYDISRLRVNVPTKCTYIWHYSHFIPTYFPHDNATFTQYTTRLKPLIVVIWMYLFYYKWF